MAERLTREQVEHAANVSAIGHDVRDLARECLALMDERDADHYLILGYAAEVARLTALRYVQVGWRRAWPDGSTSLLDYQRDDQCVPVYVEGAEDE